MEKKENKYLYILTIIMAVAIVGLSVAFASLQTQLNATFSTVSQSQASWDVHFQSVPQDTSLIPFSATNSSTDTIVCGTMSVGTDTVSVNNSTLGKPGDGCKYQVKIVNAGSLAAKLGTIAQVTPNGQSCTVADVTKAEMVCDDITFKITTDSAGSTLLQTNGVLAANNSGDTDEQLVYLIIQYTGADVAASPVNLSSGGFTLVYDQN